MAFLTRSWWDWVSKNSPNSGWNSVSIPERTAAIDNFVLNLTGVDLTGQGQTPDEDIFIAPYVPIRAIVEQISFQANDPLVHHTTGDLTDRSGYWCSPI